MKNDKEFKEYLHILQLFQEPIYKDSFWRNLINDGNEEKIAWVSGLLAKVYPYLPIVDDEDTKSMLILAARKSYLYLYDSEKVQQDIKEKLFVHVYIPAIMNGDVQIATLLFFRRETGINDIIKAASIQLPLVEYIFYDLWSGMLDESNAVMFLEIIYEFYKEEKTLLLQFVDEILEAAFVLEEEYGTSELLTNRHACVLINTLTRMYPIEI